MMLSFYVLHCSCRSLGFGAACLFASIEVHRETTAVGVPHELSIYIIQFLERGQHMSVDSLIVDVYRSHARSMSCLNDVNRGS